jgi:transposase-like protein
MGNTSKKYSAEVRDRAVRLFQEHVHEYPSRWAAMQSIAEKIGCTTQTLREWVLRAETAADPRRNAALADRERVKQLERENAELKRANEILRKASAFFAQAELDRRGK